MRQWHHMPILLVLAAVLLALLPGKPQDGLPEKGATPATIGKNPIVQSSAAPSATPRPVRECRGDSNGAFIFDSVNASSPRIGRGIQYGDRFEVYLPAVSARLELVSGGWVDEAECPAPEVGP